MAPTFAFYRTCFLNSPASLVMAVNLRIFFLNRSTPILPCVLRFHLRPTSTHQVTLNLLIWGLFEARALTTPTTALLINEHSVMHQEEGKKIAPMPTDFWEEKQGPPRTAHQMNSKQPYTFTSKWHFIVFGEPNLHVLGGVGGRKRRKVPGENTCRKGGVGANSQQFKPWNSQPQSCYFTILPSAFGTFRKSDLDIQ